MTSRPLIRRALCGALLAAVGAGCTSPAPTPTDAATTTDAATPTDVATIIDAATPTDVATTTDAATATDAATIIDAVTGTDALDAATTPDLVDAAAAPDVAPRCADVALPGPDAGPGCGEAAPTVQSGPTEGMMLVPAGAFWRGCNHAVDSLCVADEGAGRCVVLPAFEIDATEVTQEAYARCVSAGMCSPPHEDGMSQCQYHPATTPRFPATCVNWNDAADYCRWAGKRLPTEAEWEKAARGTDGRMYPWGNEPPTCERVNMVGCSNMLRDVGSLSGDSPYGLKDMAGNVWEWVDDWYDPGYFDRSPVCSPPGPSAMPANGRVGRGGGFEFLPMVDGPAVFLRTTFRHPIQPLASRVGIGFRCARSLP